MNSPFTNPPLQPSESQKVSYWLEKLFNQEKTQETTVSAEQTLEEKGQDEAVKAHAGKAEKNRQFVEDMVNNSNRILMRATSVFPWDLFPSSIIVEETRVTIIHRQLFSSQVHSIDIKNISNIFVDTSILFAQLTIVSDTFSQNKIIINRLWKKEAIFIRRIIEGLRMFEKNNINTTNFSRVELLSKLKELSETKIVL